MSENEKGKYCTWITFILPDLPPRTSDIISFQVHSHLISLMSIQNPGNLEILIITSPAKD